MRTKPQSTWHHTHTLYKNWLRKCYYVWSLGRLQRIRTGKKTQKAQKYKKIVFQKKKVENTDWYKHVLNKIMTAHE